jgi:hypothetical protein
LQLTPAQLEKLELELLAESNHRAGEAMARTIRDRGSIPRIVLDEPDKDAQRKRLLA